MGYFRRLHVSGAKAAGNRLDSREVLIPNTDNGIPRTQVQAAPALVVALPVSISASATQPQNALISSKSSRYFGSRAPIPASRGAMMGGSGGDTVWQTRNCGQSDGKPAFGYPSSHRN
jgi:hypothetical protein